MAEEVYKILQGRLRLKQAQLDNCGDQYDCDGCLHHTTKQQLDDSARRKRNLTSNAGEDPLSHKIIEKRRRDRMNSCLADLSHLIPSNYLKKGRGRIEKTEIVEMAIKHIKHLQELLPSASGSGSSGIGSGSGSGGGTSSTGETGNESTTAAEEGSNGSSGSKSGSNWQCPQEAESFKNGFSECMAESVHFLVEKEHIPPENPLCARLVNHLKRHLEQKPGLAPAGGSGSGGSSGSHGSPGAASANEVKPIELDSDYGSFSDVGSIASTQSTASSTVIRLPHSQRHYPSSMRMMMQHHHQHLGNQHLETTISNGNKDQGNVVVKRRSSEEQGPGGKFKFKDSIRERFSHEFEAKAENATMTSDHFTGTNVNTAAKFGSPGPLGGSASHQEFYAKRRRPSRSCDESGSEVNSTASQASCKSQKSQKIQSEMQNGDTKEKKSVPIFALHPKGSHYIPLSVTEEVIQPYLHLFDQGSELPLMLHPITISVNFCGPIRIAAGVRSAAHLSHRTSQVAVSGADFLQQRQSDHQGRDHQVRDHQVRS